MSTRTVVLTDHQQEFIDNLVKTGRYQSAGEVLGEGLRLVESREAEAAAKLEALRAAVAEGLADFERGDFIEFENAAALVAHLDGIAAKIAAGEDV